MQNGIINGSDCTVGYSVEGPSELDSRIERPLDSLARCRRFMGEDGFLQSYNYRACRASCVSYSTELHTNLHLAALQTELLF